MRPFAISIDVANSCFAKSYKLHIDESMVMKVRCIIYSNIVIG